MPLTMSAMVGPVRPMLKCGDVKKCGDVAGSAQNVGTSKHPLKKYPLKKWGRRQVVGTSKRPATSPQPGDVPTFSQSASDREAGGEGGQAADGATTHPHPGSGRLKLPLTKAFVNFRSVCT